MKWKPYPAYSNAISELLHQVPSHWAVKRLKFVARNVIEKATPSEGTTYLGLEQIQSRTGRYLEPEVPVVPEAETNTFQCGDVLFGKLRPYLAKAWKCSFDGICSSELLVLRPHELRQGLFAFLVLSDGFLKAVNGSTYGAKMPRASWDFIGSLRVPIPPLDEQGVMETFLDREAGKIDTLITEQRALVERLREKKQAVTSHLLTTGLDPNAARKPTSVVWFPEVPSHWKLVRLKSLVVEGVAGPYGSSLTKSVYTDFGYRVYGQQQVIPGDFSIGDYFIPESLFLDMQRYEVRPGDVLISVMGTVGKAACVPEGIEPGIINPRLVLYRVDLIHTEPKYLTAFINSQPAQAYLSLVAQGSTMDGLNMRTIEELVVPVPPMEEQQSLLLAIEIETRAIDRLIAEAEFSVALLQEHRSALITAVVTGKVDVRGAIA